MKADYAMKSGRLQSLRWPPAEPLLVGQFSDLFILSFWLYIWTRTFAACADGNVARAAESRSFCCTELQWDWDDKGYSPSKFAAKFALYVVKLNCEKGAE